MKIFKKLLFFSTPLLLTSFVSCQTHNLDKCLLAKPIEETTKNKFDKYVQNNYIQTLLSLAFDDNKEEIEKFVSQNRDLSQEKIKSFKSALLIKNNILSMYGSDDEFSFFGNNKKAYIFKNSDDILEEFSTKYWLWMLFNLDKSTFAFYPGIDLFSASAQELQNQHLSDSQIKGNFYKPLSNKIKQISIQQETQDTPGYKEYTVYLRTENDYILSLELNSYKPDNTYNANLRFYIEVYKKPTSDFDLDAYLRVTKSFYDKSANRSDSIIYNEINGAELLRYTLVDIF
ncbi:aromatic motif membrane protein [Mycoplasmopsis ciconiae]|uniref:Aromatic motif membrane protein n=1 Tax=Mycoplasmopsis ciconiae TaxID=561067 RepID=A0ABU7MLR5_9BACT|nr:aromatic motif membrane protein [Mycoplasmopsis ciconiae]